MEKFINEDTLIGEIVSRYPETMDILLEIGMHCLGCPASQAESLRDACSVHGLDFKPVVEKINLKIAESR